MDISNLATSHPLIATDQGVTIKDTPPIAVAEKGACILDDHASVLRLHGAAQAGVVALQKRCEGAIAIRVSCPSLGILTWNLLSLLL